MTDSTDVQLAVAIAEIERLRDEIAQLKGLMLQSSQIWRTEDDAKLAEIERLRARILQLEAAAALTHGTFTLPRPEDAPPVIITANHPPSAPPHVGHTIKWPPSIGNDDE